MPKLRKPKSAYQLFVDKVKQDKTKEAKKKDEEPPRLAVMMRAAAELWAQQPIEEKRKFAEKAKKLAAEVKVEHAQAAQQMEADKEAARQERLRLREERKDRRLKKAVFGDEVDIMDDNPQPVKARKTKSGFHLFLDDYKSELAMTAERDGTKMPGSGQIARDAARKWASMRRSEKGKFMRANSDMKRHVVEEKEEEARAKQRAIDEANHEAMKARKLAEAPFMCTVEGCERRKFRDELCATHLRQKLEGKDPNGPEEEEEAAKGWWDKPPEEHPVWQVCTSEEGTEYFYNTETGVTSWEKPEELMTDAEKAQHGDWRWIRDKHECYLPAKLIKTDEKKLTATVQLEDLEEDEREIKLSSWEKAHTLNKASLKRVVSDLVLLDRMNPPLILHNLRERFRANKIYTSIGTILISLNPYVRLPIYTPEVMERYMKQRVGQEMPPHVFQIAHDSYYGVTQFSKNQSIIISGESGAGKTEATKQCLAYLAKIAGSVGGVEKKVLLANPILEAFGNAKTIRNDNSSRFGKYMEISFNAKYQMYCSTTRNYLLEKIRVVQPAHNERNFHIFYQLTTAAPQELKEKLGLALAGQYRYLGQTREVDSIDDVKDYNEVMEAMAGLNFSEEEQYNMMQIITAVLSLGNVDYKSYRGKTVLEDECEQWLDSAAAGLQVGVDTLIKGLTIRELRIKGQDTTEVVLSPKQATDARNALAKFVYGNMFDWLVVKVNESVAPEGGSTNGLLYIGILDIFGFEIFEHNSFEQLCINFTNEMLQQHFNTHTFKLEEQMYQSERIRFTHVDFIDNQPMLDLITLKPVGILPLLDEELVVPRGSDRQFLSKLKNHQKKNRVFGSVMRAPGNFIVKHYAGEVTYDSHGFLEKNRDTLTTDLLEVLWSSASPLVKLLFPEDAEMSSKDKKSSLSRQFQQQLNDLMDTLNKTEPHYIRCVKPNDEKAALMFTAHNCMEQLTYSGVFEAVRIRKQGFPFRLKHEEFAERYMCILGQRELKEGQSASDVGQLVMTEMNLNQNNVQKGRTRMLYRADEHKQLELTRSIKTRVLEVNEALERLTTADMAGFTLDEKEAFYKELAEAIVGADQFKLYSPEAERARRMLDKYVAERMDPETQKKLERAFKTKRKELLLEVLAICDEKGYRTKLTFACRELLVEVEDADLALAIALQEEDDQILSKALEICDKFDYSCEAYDKARRLVYNIKRAKEMIRVATRSMEHTHLEKTLKFCQRVSYTTSAVKEVERLLEAVMYAREVIGAAMQSLDLKELKMAAEICKHMRYRSKLAQQCKELGRKVARLHKDVHKLKANVFIDPEQVMAVARRAKQVGLKSVLLQCKQLIEQARSDQHERSKQVDAAEDTLTAARKAGDPERITAALEACAKLSYESPQAAAAAKSVRNMASVKKHVKLARNKLYVNYMKACLVAAKQIGYKTSALKTFKKLTLGTREEVLKAQYARCVKIKQHARALHLSMELKDLLCAREGDQLHFSQYDFLSPAAQNRRALVHQTEKLQAPLTRMGEMPSCLEDPARAKKVNTSALMAFQAIQRYMGEGDSPKAQNLVHEVIRRLFEFSEVRDEVYLQLLKQLTRNPSQAHIKRGWVLLAAIVSVFAPSQHLENYIEAFVREHRDQSDRLGLRPALRYRCYFGSVGTGPDRHTPVSALVNQFLEDCDIEWEDSEQEEYEILSESEDDDDQPEEEEPAPRYSTAKKRKKKRRQKQQLLLT